MTALTVKKVRSKVFLYLLGSLAFVVGGLWLATDESWWSGEFQAGWLGITLGGGGALLFAKQLLFAPVVLIIDDAGFRDPRLGEAPVPWSAVAGVKLTKLEKVGGATSSTASQSSQAPNFLCIKLHEPDTWLANLSLFQKLIARFYVGAGYPRYFLNLRATDVEPTEVLRIFKARRRMATRKKVRRKDRIQGQASAK